MVKKWPKSGQKVVKKWSKMAKFGGKNEVVLRVSGQVIQAPGDKFGLRGSKRGYFGGVSKSVKLEVLKGWIREIQAPGDKSGPRGPQKLVKK